MKKRNKFVIAFLLLSITIWAQTAIVSWNIQNFGTQKKEHFALMAQVLKEADIIAIQEVQIDEDGEIAVLKLADYLAGNNGRWAYTLSEATSGKGVEKYAFIWRADKVKLISEAYLEKSFAEYADREPFIGKFKTPKGEIMIANFHAVPKKKEPWWEIKELHRLHEKYPKQNLIILGDFNLSQSDRAFEKLKKIGFIPTLENIKTTIKMEPKGDEKFANDYDNILFQKSKITLKSANRIDFTIHFESLIEARKVSDHVPVFAVFE